MLNKAVTSKELSLGSARNGLKKDLSEMCLIRINWGLSACIAFRFRMITAEWATTCLMHSDREIYQPRTCQQLRRRQRFRRRQREHKPTVNRGKRPSPLAAFAFLQGSPCIEFAFSSSYALYINIYIYIYVRVLIHHKHIDRMSAVLSHVQSSVSVQQVTA